MKKKYLGLIALLMAALLVLTACGGSSIVGTWKLTGADTGNAEDSLGIAAVFAMGASITLSFDSNGQYTMVASVLGQSQSNSGTYTIEGNKLVIDGSGVEFNVNGKVMTMKQDGQTLTFERQ